MDTKELHRKLRGKIYIGSKSEVTEESLSKIYTPGVAEICNAIVKNEREVYNFTMKGNTIAIVSDGSAVLGLGNIGAEAALPVMEGKAVLFKEFGNINAFPICLRHQSSSEIVRTVLNISPVFGGINLEDIAAPKCFEIEDILQDKLQIPVFHDDQHGTAIVVLAALINAAKVKNKKIAEMTVVVNGAGAAGKAIVEMLANDKYQEKENIPKNIIICDSQGIIHPARKDIRKNKYKNRLALITRPSREGGLFEAIEGADVFIGVSKGEVLTQEMLKKMNPQPIVFALANPIPEILPSQALEAGALIVGTGRSDFPNQINNVLAFPGIFSGALRAKASKITEKMKLAAANSLASEVIPRRDAILPSVLNKTVSLNIAQKVYEIAKNGLIQ